jgi:hypothetical protein
MTGAGITVLVVAFPFGYPRFKELKLKQIKKTTDIQWLVETGSTG